jgi:CBS domain-containing protein
MNTLITVGTVLQKKGQGFIAVGPDAMAFDALELMAERNIGALLVMEDGRLLGVFSERDYARKVILKGKSSKTPPIRELMSSPPITIRPDELLRDAMVVMTEKRVRHLPVVENDRLLGVVTIGDIVNSVISEQASTIEELEEYIAGTGYRA